MASAARPIRASRPRLEDLVDDLVIESAVDESDSDEEDILQTFDDEEQADLSDEVDQSDEEDPTAHASSSGVVTTKFEGKDKTTWDASPLPRGTPSRRQGRAPRHQIVREAGGPRQSASFTSIPRTFSSFITDEIIREIVKMTNRYAHQWIHDNESEWYQKRYREVDDDEMRAFLGCLLLAGVYKSHGESYEQLWSDDQGRTIFGATMSLRRFQTILKFLRFDDKNTREQRRASDKLAPFREIWTMFVTRCRNNFTVGPNATIDEQLVSFRGRCLFKVYMPSKPDKYGIKVWVMCDSATAYASNLEIYMGKTGDHPEAGQAARVVRSLSLPLHWKEVGET